MRHKGMFFAERAADRSPVDYAVAVAGGVRLVPAGDALKALEDDYAGMVEDGLLLVDAEPFEALMTRRADIAARANNAVTAEELYVVKSLHRARTQGAEFSSDVVVSVDGDGIRKPGASYRNPTIDRWRHEHPRRRESRAGTRNAAARPECQLAGVAWSNPSASTTRAGSGALMEHYKILHPNHRGWSGV
jgi:hypothetical protein